ncbi:uncharacterized protein LOC115350420 [Aquila chrysaetos chrysaetos]|uniref:uncharacterized protein LOC115350420 n=1 Tax=Aquila chrysaetos chrysaetos TaxID=223781 RepID=UPI0011764C94|nr:uncharacterized protein LOC115350420 [Aquila chrysaetos chrysaetos]XP_029891920.1 uncharacterized protein LOC115350420 [Aquila chrysaetos chrysaetos]XP_029891921.1 uncharacterized protein LOC115350420 [Aquila chrysaetos chrysaetos]XP_040984489.1 uncharacterized protein LOC115350420 [Aquila chrysaetos chrysaetos]XP_040984490.1 uncharacterized protein LOC115350420 [Aquila chrysaetos chrysaetos]XP_040984492.1 uncharacterized protein LOC115350420 [Aquila chrysaetos chrysaetos]XP_040984493.1 un
MILSPSLSPAPCPLFPPSVYLSCFLSLVILPLSLCPAACLIVSNYSPLSSQLSFFSFLPPYSGPTFSSSISVQRPITIFCLLHLLICISSAPLPQSLCFLSLHVLRSILVFLSLFFLPFPSFFSASLCPIAHQYFSLPSLGPAPCPVLLCQSLCPVAYHYFCCLHPTALLPIHLFWLYPHVLLPSSIFFFLQLSDLLPALLFFSLSFFPLPCTSLQPCVLLPVPLFASLSLCPCPCRCFFFLHLFVLLPISVQFSFCVFFLSWLLCFSSCPYFFSFFIPLPCSVFHPSHSHSVLLCVTCPSPC